MLTDTPFFGYRKVAQTLQKNVSAVTGKQVRRVMRRFGLYAIYPGRNLSKARQMNKKYPYLRWQEKRYGFRTRSGQQI